MVYFIIGVPKIQGNANTSIDRVNTSLGSHATLFKVTVDTSKYKLGNFDNMMLNYENVTKLEGQVEGLIKRIQKSYLDVEPKADLSKMVVESKDLGTVNVDTFITKFGWDDSKYPRNQQLADLLKIIGQRIATVDNNLKNKNQAYQDSKNAASQGNKKDTGSITIRNLNELFLTNKNIKPSDFINTPHLQTAIAIVPEKEVAKWQAEYEMLNDYIVPRSSMEIPVGSEIGPFKLFRFVFLRRMAEDIIKDAKSKLNMTVREFTYDVDEIMRREEARTKIASQTTNDVDNLRKTCIESFKDIYSTYAHIKFLKVVIDSQMRFGSADDFVLLTVKLTKGKEKRIHEGLIGVFADKSKKDFYGTKEQLNDSEDFFPYAFAQVDLP